MEHQNQSAVIFSLYLGSGTANNLAFPSGNLTITCSSNFNDNIFLSLFDRIVNITTDPDTGVSYEDIYYEGNGTFSVNNGSIYFTRNATESQKFYVSKELYEYASKQMKDISCPTYSFELSTANPIFAKEFEPFKNALQLGCGCYLKLKDDLITRQMLLEVHLDFEDPTKFKLIFSNEFKRPDKVNTMKKQIQNAVGANRTLDLKKLAYGSPQTSGLYNVVQEFIKEGLDAAATQVLAGKTQNITVDQRGIKIATAGSKEYLLMADGMIAIIDHEGHSKMAMGHFYNTASGQNYYGVLADVIGGDLVIGSQLNIMCPDINGGIAQFKVDSSGVFLNNSRFYLQSDGGGKIGMDARHGFFCGTSSLFDLTDTGHVKPVFIDGQGKIKLDGNGFPIDTNFWVDIRTGNVYVRGTIYATDGIFNGTIHAHDGDFSGTIRASVLDGKLVGGTNGGLIEGVGLNIGNGAFTVDRNGNVVIQKGSISWGAVTGTDEIDQRIQNAQSTANRAVSDASGAYNKAASAADALNRLVGGTYSTPTSTFIDGKTVRSPTIEAGILNSAIINSGRLNSAVINSSELNSAVINSGELSSSTINGGNIYGTNIYGANIYADNGSRTYVKILESGMRVFINDVNTPKIELFVDESGAYPSFALGAGSGGFAGTSNRFFIQKKSDRTILCYIDNYGNQSGFSFMPDGRITVLGNLDVTAKFA